MESTIEAYCMFIGYSRSGSTLIGSLLEAHPNITIAIKLDALKYLAKNQIRTRQDLFAKLIKQSQQFLNQQCACAGCGHTFKVLNSYQGRNTELKVIGDNAAGSSTLLIKQYPDLLNRLKKIIGMDIKFIHVIRNPFDMIASEFQHTYPKRKSRGYTIQTSILRVFDQIRTMQKIKKLPFDILDVYHEELLQNTDAVLNKICSFLSVVCHSSFLTNCKQLINSDSHKSRFEVEWPPGALNSIQTEFIKYKFLEKYVNCFSEKSYTGFE